MKMKKPTNKLFIEFKLKNRSKANRYLNYVLWFFVIAPPAIALGIKAGFFYDVTYATCGGIFGVVVTLSLIHLILYKAFPTSLLTSLFALTAVDALLVYMALSHVSIYLTWFLVPLLGLLFCDAFIFIYAVGLNTVLMVITTILSGPHLLALRTDYDDTSALIADVLGGFLIETLVMLSVGFILLRLTQGYLSKMFDQKAVIKENERSVREKMEILDSMAEIYDNVNLIDFSDNTETSLRDSEQKKHGIDMSSQTHTLMNQRLKEQVMPDQLEAFLEFTNITTVRSRLTNKKLISADFIDVREGWFRAQYITVDSSPDGVPNTVIYTTRNVDDEKRREERLIRIAVTDEMTRLYNRRCYDEDLFEYRKEGLPEDFVLISVDINGLKPVNDNKGHAAGDELIKGTADCLALSLGGRGKAYRTGGDEFMAIVLSPDPERIRSEIMKKAGEWRGVYSDELNVSVGYAAFKDTPGATVDELERLADSDMYAEKEKFYKERNIKRRT